MGKFDALIKKLEIDETFTTPVKKPKRFTKVKDQIPLVSDYNFMADLLFLPHTEKGFKYLLVVVDLATDEFDIEPLKDKNPESVLKAMKAMFKRPYIKKPEYSIKTDSGSEFKGVFQKYLFDNSIYHSVALPNRHTQLANVELLNRTLGRLLNGYMNSVEEKTGKEYKEWTEALPLIRDELNALRKKKKRTPLKPYIHIQIFLNSQSLALVI